MRGSTIVGVGSYLPERVISSETVAETLGVTADWVHSRTGIRTRHAIAPGQTVVDLATRAATSAILHSGVPTALVDAVIVATSTGERMPNTASQVAAALGLHGVAFDVNAACAGFSHAIAVADGLIRAGGAHTVLVIGADISTSSLDWHDRYTAPLFADGAGAALVEGCDRNDIGPTLWGSQGEHGDLVTLTTGDMIRQAGPTVFRWAIALGEHIRAIIGKAGLEPSEIAAFVPHQANLRIINALAAEFLPGRTVIARDVVDVGNTMAASIPIALARMADRGELPIGEPVLLFGFGSGLTYAGQTVRFSRSLHAVE